MNKNIKKLILEQFYPIVLLKDCNKGNQLEQLKSYIYNKEHADILEIPILNWLIITIYSFILLGLTEKYIISSCTNIICAFLGICFAISTIIMLLFLIAYLFLNNAKLITKVETK